MSSHETTPPAPLRHDDGSDRDWPVPVLADRTTWQKQLDELLVREKAHTREGDAIAAARRRLPMVEVDGSAALQGKDGPSTLLDAFEGRRMLVAYFHMWHDGEPAPGQCEGCTFFSGQVRELSMSYLHSRDVTWAVFSQGPYPESSRYREFMGYEAPWYSVIDREALVADRWFGMQVCYLRVGDRVHETYWSSGRAPEVFAPSYGLLDMTVYGRQEPWEDSPDGWPQQFTADSSGGAFRLGGRPIGQWPRVEQGYDDTLS